MADMRYNNQWEIQESKVVGYKASEILKRSIMQVRLLVILNISDNNNHLKITKGFLYATVRRAYSISHEILYNPMRLLLLLSPFYR